MRRAIARVVLRRAMLALLSLVGITVVTFALVHLAPGDPTAAGGAPGQPLSARAAAAQRRLFFLDLPLFFNPRPRGVEARVARLLRQARQARGAREREAAVGRLIACDTACAVLFARDSDWRSLGEGLRTRVVDGLRRRHPRLYGGQRDDDRWLARIAEALAPERLHRLSARIGRDGGAQMKLDRAGSAALPAILDVLLDDGEIARARRAAAALASHLTGISGQLRDFPGSPSWRATLARWREWWFQNRRSYAVFDRWDRLAGHLAETQFGKWAHRVLHLSFGYSLRDGRAVSDKVAEALPVTLLLSLLAIGLAYLVAVPVGVHAAVHRGSRLERSISTALIVLYALPSFWVAMMLIWLLGGVGVLDLFPIHGLGGEGLAGWSWVVDRAHHLVLPVFCLSYGALAVLSRYQRGAMLEVLRQQYIRTARAKGLPERTVLLRHGLRNALLPMITLFGLHFPYLISGSVIIERIFNIPGMGLLTFDAYLQRDYPVIMAVALLSAVMTLIGLLLADLLYAVADPRISRAEVSRDREAVR